MYTETLPSPLSPPSLLHIWEYTRGSMPLGLARCGGDGSWAQQCKNCVNKPYLNRTLVTDGWLVGGLSVVFGWRVGMVWALWDDVHAAENF